MSKMIIVELSIMADDECDMDTVAEFITQAIPRAGEALYDRFNHEFEVFDAVALSERDMEIT